MNRPRGSGTNLALRAKVAVEVIVLWRLFERGTRGLLVLLYLAGVLAI
jgi:hypothetical protein